MSNSKYKLPDGIVAGRDYRVDPDNPKFEGIYYRYNVAGVKTFCIKKTIQGVLIKETIGAENNGFNKNYALAYLSEKIRDVRLGKVLPGYPSRLTMNSAFNFYVGHLKGTAKSPRYIESEFSKYNRHIQPYLGNMRLDKIQSIDIEYLKPKWQACDLSLEYRSSILHLIGRIYKRMDKLGKYKGHNPYSGVDKISVRGQRERFLTQLQVSEILESIRNENLRIWRIACFAALTGMRRSEILRVRPIDIDLANNIITVKTKDNKEERTRAIEIPARLLDVISDLLGEHNWKPGDYLFSWTSTDDKRFKRYIDATGLNDGLDLKKDRKTRVVFHTLRHCYGSWLVSMGIDLRTVQEMMGHKNLQSTLVYSKFIPGLRKEAIRDLSATFNYLDIGI
jgi:integrase